ncbi:MAG: ATP-dependent Clp protease ATP-binding subunit, partial [Patescibacteria group bacterium]|nr:ATP-dependent Clp protease ATP-binding subunit [Patescibacteria group bacterium]
APGEKEKDLLLHFEDKLHERIIGQEEAVKAIAQAIRRVRAGLATQTRPISFLFLGSTGVGKTEAAKALAMVYFGGEDKTIRLDMSEFTAMGSVNRLLGATAGQGDEKGELTEKVAAHPFSLVMLDEFEKAHPEVLDLFLQVLEDGRLTDNHGKLVSFANTIIIATSNAGALYIQEQLKQGKQIDAAFQQGLLEEIEKEHIFKPELLNRFDGIIVFRPLQQADMEKITKLYLDQVQKKLVVQDIQVLFDPSIVSLCATQGFDPQFGARPLRRFIQDHIEDAIAKSMLEGKINRGAILTVSADATGTVQLSQ